MDIPWEKSFSIKRDPETKSRYTKILQWVEISANILQCPFLIRYLFQKRASPPICKDYQT
jgi:hypothetical protein